MYTVLYRVHSTVYTPSMDMGGRLEWLVILGILWKTTLASYVPAYGASSLIIYNVTDIYNRFPDVTNIAESDYEYFISELNFDAIDGKIIAGAADKLLLLDPELGMLDELQWEADAASLSMCSDDNANYACRNHIRVYRRIPANQDLLFVCGTQAASENSQCRTVDISLGNFSALSVPVVVSDGIISYYPEFSGFGEFRNGDSTDMTYFTAGFFDGPDGVGRHFSISYQKVNFTDTADPDTLLTTESFRTINANNFWLRFPVTFVDYYRADYAAVLPATSASDYQFYYVFLRENLFDDSSPLDVVFTRVVRICRNDPGSMSATNDARHFTTYMKARIFCTRKVPMGRDNVGSIDYEYNNMRSMVFNEDGRYYEDGDWVKMMYGAFTGPLNGPLGSALCVYRADNSFETSGSGFEKGIFDIFREDLQDSDTGTEVQNLFTECNPAGRSDSDAQNQVLIVPDVDQIGDDPLLVFEGRYISQMVLDQVCVVRSQDDTKCLNQDVLFLGTDTGVIMKVVFGTNGTNTVPVIAEEISLDDSNPINKMQLQVVDDSKYLYVSTWSKIYQLPLERCSRGLSCSECIGSRDPYCVWNTDNTTCEASMLTATDNAEGNVPNNIKQNIHTDAMSPVCNFPEVGFNASSFQANESDSSVQLTVTATTTGLSGYVELYTESGGTAEAGVDYTAQVSSVIFPMGQTEAVVTVDIINDDIYEGNEYFLVRLRDSGVGAVTITQDTATVTILDDDVVTVEFQYSELTVSESECYLNVTVVKRGLTNHTVNVNFFTVDDNATAEEDYVSTEEELEFAPDEYQKTVVVPIINDEVLELTEVFLGRIAVVGGQPGVQVGQDTAAVTITNDDFVSVEFAETAYSVSEVGSAITISITKTGSSATSISAVFATADGTATAPSDYTMVAGMQVAFAPDESEKNVTVSITDDSVLEPLQTFSGVLIPSGEVTVGGNSETTISIIDDDSVMVEFESSQYGVSEENGSVEVSLVKQGSSDIAVSVWLSTLDAGSASVPGDYSALTNVELVFQPSDVRIVYTIPLANDAVHEAEELFMVALSLPTMQTGVTLGTVIEANVTITDDDTIQLGFDTTEITISEDSGTVGLVIIKTGLSAIPVTVSLQLGDAGSAMSPSDYSGVSPLEITFASETTIETVQAQITNDTVHELTETFFAMLTLSGGQSGVSLVQDTTTVTITDDDSVTLGFESMEYSSSEADGFVNVTIVKTGSSAVNVSVVLSTEDGSATAPDDYITISNLEITFEPGESQKMVSILIEDNAALENTESFMGVLSIVGGQTGVQLGQYQTTIQVNDDDTIMVGFESSEYSVSEEDGSITISVQKTGSSDVNVTVVFTTTDGNATASDDYVSTEVEIPFSPTDTEYTVTVPLRNDETLESTESFTAMLSVPSSQSGVELTSLSTTITITDNDMVTVRFESLEYTASEADGSASVRVRKEGQSVNTISVQFTTLDGSAQSPGDYGAVSGMEVSFAPDEYVKTVSIAITDDTILELTETFSGVLDSSNDQVAIPTGENTTTVTITDDDSVTVEFLVAEYTVSEGDGAVNVTIAMSGSSSIPVRVTFTTEDGSATAPDDYITISNLEITFEPGESQKMVSILIEDNAALENTESFMGVLSIVGGQTGVQLGQYQTTIQVNDDDTIMVGFESSEYSVSEEDGSITISVQKTGSSDVNVTVVFTTADGNATTSDDYVSTEVEITFSPTDTEYTVTVPLRNDETLESTESFTAVLSIPSSQSGVELTSVSTTITITDSDMVTVRFESLEYTASEADGSASVRVRKEGQSVNTISVQFTTLDGSAQSPGDYGAVSGMEVSFAPDEYVKTVSIAITNDTILELTETFSGVLDSSNDQVAIPTGENTTTVTITDDDSVTVEFLVAEYTVSEGDGAVNVTIAMSGSSSIPVRVTFTTEDGSATAPSDYSDVQMDIEFDASGTQEIVTVPVVSDAVHEPTKSFAARLSLPAAQRSVVLGQSIATIVINDDDVVTIQFAPSEYNASESAGFISLTVMKIGASTDDIVVLFSTMDGEATAPADYSAIDIELCFTMNVSEQTILIPVINDDLHEPDESFSAQLNLTGDLSTGVQLGQASAIVAISDSNSVAVRFETTQISVSEGDGSVNILIVKEGPTNSTINVTFSTDDGTASDQQDYGSTVVVISFAPSEFQKTVAVPIISDAILEAAQESFIGRLTLTNPAQVGVAVTQGMVTVDIIDDDTVTVGLTATEYSTVEGDGSLMVEVAVNSGLTDVDITVVLSTQSETAQAPADYSPLTLQVNFTASSLEERVEIQIETDNTLEATETFAVVLSLPSDVRGVQLDPDRATITITDDDSVNVSFEQTQYTVTEGDGVVSIAVVKNGSAAIPVTVTLNTTDDTATAPGDYIASSTEVIFEPNDVRKTVSVTIIDDDVDETTEVFTVGLSVNQNDIIVPGDAVITITDDDETTIGPDTTQLFFQLVISLEGMVDSCGDWIECQNTMKAQGVVNAIVEEVVEDCSCDFSSGNIARSGFTCSDPSSEYVVFRAELVVSGEPDASKLLEFIEQWIKEEPQISVDNVLLKVDDSNNCAVGISSFDDALCNVDGPVTTATEALSTRDCAISDDGLLSVVVVLCAVIVILLMILIIVVCVLCRKQRRDSYSLKTPLIDGSGAEGTMAMSVSPFGLANASYKGDETPRVEIKPALGNGTEETDSPYPVVTQEDKKDLQKEETEYQKTDIGGGSNGGDSGEAGDGVDGAGGSGQVGDGGEGEDSGGGGKGDSREGGDGELKEKQNLEVTSSF